MFIDGAEEATIGQYANYGPNNEVYLAQGQAISFKLTDNTNEIASIQIGGDVKSKNANDFSFAATDVTPSAYTPSGM